MRREGCSREIPDDAVLCPYCGQRVISSDQTVASPPPVRKRTGIWAVIIAILTIAVVCFGCMSCWAVGTTTPSHKAASTGQAARADTTACIKIEGRPFGARRPF